MIFNFINLLQLIFFGILYIFTFSKVQNVFYNKISKPKNNATLIVYLSSIAVASINLIHISDAASDVVLYFLKQESLIKGILFSTTFFSSSWIFSFLFIRGSFYIIGQLTPENEIDELKKDNKEIALIHALIIVGLSFVIAPTLSKIATSFIPYPELPF